ncbi:hypothetical protein SUGI_0189740 [Cryptomeria japonica]|nr:hypothetical protein SUGI_0189740 [Cryptomeria japonica]
MAGKSDDLPTLNRKKQVIITIYHIDVEDTVVRTEKKKGKKSKFQAHNGGAVSSQPRKLHIQSTRNTRNNQRRPIIKHGYDRKAEILQRYQQKNRQSGGGSVNNNSQIRKLGSTQAIVHKTPDVNRLKNGKQTLTASHENGNVEIEAKPETPLLHCRKNGTTMTNTNKALPISCNGDLKNPHPGTQKPARPNKGADNKPKERWTVIQSTLCGLPAKCMNATLSPQKILPKNRNGKIWHSKILPQIQRLKKLCKERLVLTMGCMRS